MKSNPEDAKRLTIAQAKKTNKQTCKAVKMAWLVEFVTQNYEVIRMKENAGIHFEIYRYFITH